MISPVRDYSDGLMEFAEICEEATTPNCISIGATLDALTDPLRLGLGNCMASEMVTGTFDATRGYRCDKEACGVNQPTDGEPTAFPTLREQGATQYGVSLDSLMAAADCDKPVSPDSPGMGLSFLEDGMRCLTTALDTSSTRISFKCLARKGQDNPVEAYELRNRTGERERACKGPRFAEDKEEDPTPEQQKQSESAKEPGKEKLDKKKERD